MNTPTAYLREIGRKGGESKSATKLESVQRNLKKAWAAQREKKREREAKKNLK